MSTDVIEVRFMSISVTVDDQAVFFIHRLWDVYYVKLLLDDVSLEYIFAVWIVVAIRFNFIA